MQLARQLSHPSFRSETLLPPLDSEGHNVTGKSISAHLDPKQLINIVALVLSIFGCLPQCIYKPT